MVLLHSPGMELLEFSASGINPQLFSHLICNKLKDFVPSVAAKLAQTGGLIMSVPGLIWILISVFYLCSKAFESFLILFPQGSVAQIFFFFVKSEQMVMDCQRFPVLHLPLLLSLSSLILIANRTSLLSQTNAYVWADKCFNVRLGCGFLFFLS